MNTAVCKKVGLDDFFVRGGTVPALRELLAIELPPLSLDAKLALLDTTDTGNAERLAARFGEDLRYCHTWKTWLVWNGKHWQRDETGQAMEYAKKTARFILAEAAATTDDAQRKALVTWSQRTQGRDRLQAMLALTQSLSGIRATAEEFDADAFLLNVANGTLDLRTGILRESERDDMLTKTLYIPYDAQAQCPKFRQFLERVQPDPEMRTFLQRATGYTLTGDISEECLLFLYGEGQNGKSKFIRVLEETLGDYAVKTRAETIMQKRDTGGIPNDVAALAGARMVSAAELDTGQTFNEALVKDLTGGDAMSARFLFENFFKFTPQFTLWMYGNYKPKVRGTDNGIWRRIRLVPFAVTIPPEERDNRLSEKLKTELTGVLAWAVQGCLDWQREGLGEPPAVVEATAEYRAEMDALAQFIDDRCFLAEAARVSKAMLWQSYEAWAKQAGERQYATQRTFNAAMKRRPGIDDKPMPGGAKGWQGITLRPDDESDGSILPDMEEPKRPSLPLPATTSVTKSASDDLLLPNVTENSYTSRPILPREKKIPENTVTIGNTVTTAPPLLITATASMQQTARTLAEQRTRAHDGSRAPSACHGSDEVNRSLDYFGLRAEIALMDALERHGLTPQGYQFLTARPPSEPDFTLCGLRYDVKACPTGKEYVSINAGKHENPATRPDFYALCLFESDMAFTVAIVSAADVDTWEKRDGVEKADGTRRKPYFSQAKDTLPQITSLDAFAAQTTAQEGAKRDWK